MLTKADANKKSYEGETVRGVDFSDVNAQGMIFVGAMLINCDFGEVQFKDSDFTGAMLMGCNLRKARFSGCTLDGVLFEICRMSHVAMAYTSCVQMSIEECNVEGVHYCNCDLRNAKLPIATFDARGYTLSVLYREEGPQFVAGCRDFNIEEAIAHWGSQDYWDSKHGSMYAAMCKLINEEYLAGNMHVKPGDWL